MTEKPNLLYINDLAGESKEFKQKLIEILKREFPLEKAIFLKNYRENNYESAAENVHKLKHKIGMLGFEKEYQTTLNFEGELLKEEYSLFPKFMLILEAIEEFLITI